MTKKILIIGSSGRMARDTQELLIEKNIPFDIMGSKSSTELKSKDWSVFEGLIDFSTPLVAKEIAEKLQKSPCPWVCGTTGWNNLNERDELLNEAARSSPVLYDSNFSLGVELFCRSLESIAGQISETFFITDFHHAKKKDSPSGTALKIADRIKRVQTKAQIEFRDIRAGHIAGEHRVFVAWNDESLEFTHRAQSKRVFSEGALKALHWLRTQKPGLYSMKDVS